MHMRPGMYSIEPPSAGSMGSGVGCGSIATARDSDDHPLGRSRRTVFVSTVPPAGETTPTQIGSTRVALVPQAARTANDATTPTRDRKLFMRMEWLRPDRILRPLSL